MTPLRTLRGGRINVVLPEVEWKPLRQAKAAYEGVVAEKRATSKRLEELAATRSAAIAADRAALAAAIRSGSERPDDTQVQAVDAEITAAQRDMEALELALDLAEQELVEVVSQHRKRWLRSAGEAVEKARAEYAAKVEVLAEARERVDEARALSRWIAGFPAEQQSYRLTQAPVSALRKQNGQPPHFSEVVNALRQDAAPHAERESDA